MGVHVLLLWVVGGTSILTIRLPPSHAIVDVISVLMFELGSILINRAIYDNLSTGSNLPAILNDLQLTVELFVGFASHVLGALGELRRGLLSDPELPYNLILAPERAIYPALILAVVDEFAALATAETATVSVELRDFRGLSHGGGDSVLPKQPRWFNFDLRHQFI